MLKKIAVAKIILIELEARNPIFVRVFMEISITYSNLIQILFWTFISAATVQISYYVFIFLRLAIYKGSRKNTKLEPVSIVICARNEEDNLLEKLPGIFRQDYPEFQVIVVDHASWDGTGDVLKAFKLQYPNLHIVTLAENDRFDGGKKLALTLGIKAAKFNQILLTDADCEPTSRHWIKEMMAARNENIEVILGYSPYNKVPGVLNGVVRFGSFFSALQYFSYALSGIPYMGVGRNLSYLKDTFFAVGGFKKHYSISSGDDDLFINEVAKSKNTAICLDKNAWMMTDAVQTWKSLWAQRRRHFSTSRKYKFGHKLLLLLYPVSLFIYFIAFFTLLVLEESQYVILAVFAVRLFLQLFIFRQSMKHLGQRDLLWLSPFLELFETIYNTAVHTANLFRKQGKWKT